METYVEQYQSKHGGVTLHTWREREGQKEGNLHYRGGRHPGGRVVPGEAASEPPRRYRDFP